MPLDILKTPTGFLKLCEIAIGIIIIGVSQGVEDFKFGGDERTFYCGGAFITPLVITPCLLIAYLRGAAREIQRTPLEVKFNLVLAILMLSAGAVTINTSLSDLGYTSGKFPKASNACKAVGSFGIINAVIYLLDAYFAKQAMD